MFGPDFEKYGQETADEKEKSSNQNAPAAVGKATKGKIAAKATGHTYQFQIMESIGVPRSEIKKFADPYYWLTYFPPICMVSSSRSSVRMILKYLWIHRRITHHLAHVSIGVGLS